MDRGPSGATIAEIGAAVVSTGVATVATFARSSGMLAPTSGTFLFMVLGFTGLSISRGQAAQGDPRGRVRLAMAGVAFAAAAATFLFFPAVG